MGGSGEGGDRAESSNPTGSANRSRMALGVCNGPLDQLTCAGAMGVTTHRGFGPFAVDPEGRGRPPGLGLARGRGRVEGCRSALSTSEPASRPDYLQSPPRGGRGVERWLGFSLHVGDPVPCRRASGRPRVGRPSHAHLGSARRARAGARRGAGPVTPRARSARSRCEGGGGIPHPTPLPRAGQAGGRPQGGESLPAGPPHAFLMRQRAHSSLVCARAQTRRCNRWWTSGSRQGPWWRRNAPRWRTSGRPACTT